MAAIAILIQDPGQASANNTQRRYGIVNGGGTTQSRPFADIKAKLIADVTRALGPNAGYVSVTFNGFTNATSTQGAYGSDGTLATINTGESAAQMATRLRIAPSGSDLTLDSVSMAARLIPFLESLGVGSPCNIAVSSVLDSDAVRAQAGVSF